MQLASVPRFAAVGLIAGLMALVISSPCMSSPAGYCDRLSLRRQTSLRTRTRHGRRNTGMRGALMPRREGSLPI